MKDKYLCLAIGNSHLHWALFQDTNLQMVWNTEHLKQETIDRNSLPEILPFSLRQKIDRLPLYMASVVPKQTAIWVNHPRTQVFSWQDIALQGIYPTMGIDRALAVCGAIDVWGYPCLVIDGGTALTYTGIGSDRDLIGGAILPGFQLQLVSLQQKTAALPRVNLSQQLPQPWAKQTQTAIESGVIYTMMAGIQYFINDWCDRFPNSQIIFTGGDSEIMLVYLKLQNPQLAAKISIDRYLIFWGMRSLIFKQI